ncbi:RING finger protein [Striga asiatica]|uniref:RING finger protein n=1 Tax=Striga asiatica TaxID=4170 RepID=A0A5A7Q287_STRAF|nr:RING finger protein [Striga asiatica]
MLSAAVGEHKIGRFSGVVNQLEGYGFPTEASTTGPVAAIDNTSSSNNNNNDNSSSNFGPSSMADEEEITTRNHGGAESSTNSKDNNGNSSNMGGTDDEGWLQLSIGLRHPHTTSASVTTIVNVRPNQSNPVELELMPNRDAYLLGSAIGAPQGLFSTTPFLFQATAAANFSSHPQNVIVTPAAAAPRPFQSVYDDVAYGRRPGLDFRVVQPPRRPQSGIWFMLQASQNQEREACLPQISKSYLRIKDGRMTIRLVIKYLANKLRLENESQVRKMHDLIKFHYSPFYLCFIIYLALLPFGN